MLPTVTPPPRDRLLKLTQIPEVDDETGAYRHRLRDVRVLHGAFQGPCRPPAGPHHPNLHFLNDLLAPAREIKKKNTSNTATLPPGAAVRMHRHPLPCMESSLVGCLG